MVYIVSGGEMIEMLLQIQNQRALRTCLGIQWQG